MRKNILALAIVACALLAIPALASARPTARDFNHTFPHAARLCDKAAGGDAPKRLAAASDKVKVACETLHTSFAAAQTTFTAAVAPLRQQATDAMTALRATCETARANHDLATCRAAHERTRETIKSLRTQAREAMLAYHDAIQAARKAFWSTIRELRGGSAVEADRTAGPDPTVTLPSDSQVAGI